VTLAEAIVALVAETRAVGYKYHAEQQILARFEGFARSEFPGLESLTEASVQAWIASARQRDVQPATLQALAAPVRELARWLARRGVAAYLLPGSALPKPARYVPHIYTDTELTALFQSNRPLPVLFGGPAAPPGHAGAVPHHLRVWSACLRSAPAPCRGRRHRCRRAPDPRGKRWQRPPGAGVRGAAHQARRLPQPRRQAPECPGVVLPRQGRPAAHPRQRRSCRTVVSSHVFDTRGHPNKSRDWVFHQYFGMFNRSSRDRWVFGDRETGAYLLRFGWTKIVRHQLVPGRASPDDPTLADYWARRRRRNSPLLDAVSLRLLQGSTGAARRVGGCCWPPTMSPNASPSGSSGSWSPARRSASKRSPPSEHLACRTISPPFVSFTPTAGSG
jgi:hypothetical protein